MLSQLPTIQQIKQTLNQAERVLLITHQHPDGDGLGAITALGLYLKSLGKNYQLFCLDEAPPSCSFLPDIHQLSSDPKVFNQQFDVVVVADAGDLAYAGVDTLLVRENFKTLINIDHHATNSHFGDLNLVISEFSSASEIIYQMFKLWQAAINKDTATALLNGIIFDTGAFSNAATSLSALKASAHLLNLGARHNEINLKYLKNKSLSLLKLWGRAFERLCFNPRYDLAYTVILQKDFAELGVDPEASSGLTNFFNELAGVKIVMLLVEQPDGFIKGSLRTTSDEADVAKVAKFFGGGGHKKAAGFSIPGRLVYNESKWEIV